MLLFELQFLIFIGTQIIKLTLRNWKDDRYTFGKTINIQLTLHFVHYYQSVLIGYIYWFIMVENQKTHCNFNNLFDY